MSLLGYDTPAVNAAHDAAVEDGGWFWLHYTARDTVEIMSQGTNGVEGMKAEAQRHAEKDHGSTPSPLFGLIAFKRRKVLVRLILEGTSRLIQARAQVHFNSFEDKFTANEPNCEISSPNQLTESALVANKDLHSSRPSKGAEHKDPKILPPLGGIAESTEEPANKAREVIAPAPTPPAKTTPTKAPKPEQAEKTPSSEPQLARISFAPLELSSITQLTLPSSPERKPEKFTPQETITDSPSKVLAPVVVRTSLLDVGPTESATTKSPPIVSEPLASPTPEIHIHQEEEEDDDKEEETPDLLSAPTGQRADSALSAHSDLTPTSPRPSTQSGRKSIDDLFGDSLDFSFLDKKPKVKLGPRPTMDRRQVSSRTSTDARPTAALPSGFRISRFPTAPISPSDLQSPNSTSSVRSPSFVKTPTTLDPAPNRPVTRDTNYNFDLSRPLPPPPPIPQNDIYSIPRPKSSSGTSIKSLPPMLPKSPGNSKERQRLMKFREMYKKKEANAKNKPIVEQTITEAVSEDKGVVETESGPETSEASDEARTKLQDENAAPLPVPESPSSYHTTQEDQHNSPSSNINVVHSTQTSESIPASQPSPASVEESIDPNSTRPTSLSEVSERISPESSGEKSLLAVDQPTDSSQAASLEPNKNNSSETSSTTPTMSPSVVEDRFRDDANPTEFKNRDSHVSTSTISTKSSPYRASGHDEDKHGSSDSLEMDEDDIDELSEAEVRVATPVDVTKSPMTSMFGKRMNSQAGNNRSSSAPQPNLAPIITDGFLNINKNRKVVPQSPITTPTEDMVPLSKKRVEGGIAAKIADLQRNFSRGPATSQSPRNVSNKTLAERASGLPAAQQAEPAVNPRRLSKIFTSSKKPVSNSTDAESPSSVGPHSPVHHEIRIPINQPNTMAQTAETTTDFPVLSSSNPFPSFLNNHPSKTHRKSSHPRSASVSSQPSMPGSPTPSDSRGFSVSSETSSWRPFGHRKSLSKSPRPPNAGFFGASNTSLDTTISIDDKNDSASTKKGGSRAGRLIKRMGSSISSLTGIRGLQTLNERPSTAEHQTMNTENAKPPALAIGDLNVQFPDTLLWKRRWVEIDQQGYLVLRPNAGGVETNTGSVIKRYHLNEFQPPFTPDLDRQELLHSIILDFRDGRSLQCAAEGPESQRQVLYVLSEYHRAWLS